MTRVTLRLPDELHRRLRVHSQRTGVSLNQVIVSTLSTAVPRDDGLGREQDDLAAQTEHIRAVLGDAVVTIDIDALPEHLRPGHDLPDTAALAASLPVLDPPLSATIIADRGDRF